MAQISLKILLVAAGCCCGPAAGAQALIALLFGKKINNDRISMGLQLGLQETTVTNISDWRPRSSFAIGAYTDIRIGEKDSRWSVSIYSLFKSTKGVNHLQLDQQITVKPETTNDVLRINRKMTYFEVLPFMRYRLSQEWFAGLGMDIGFRTMSKDEFIARGDGEKLSYQVSTKDQIELFDFGLAAGIQYRMQHGKGIKLSLHYAQGLTNIYKTDHSGLNCTLHIGVGIPIGGQEDMP